MKNTTTVDNILKYEVDVVERWDKLGLLEGLAESKKLELATELENMARRILTQYARNPMTDKEENMAGILLPLVRRLYNNGVIIDNKTLYDYVYDNYEKYYGEVDSLADECEATCKLCDDLIKKT